VFMYAYGVVWCSEAEVLDGQREAELLESRHEGDKYANYVGMRRRGIDYARTASRRV
jgi:hypothetical protein